MYDVDWSILGKVDFERYKVKIIFNKDKLCLLSIIFEKKLLWHFQRAFHDSKK